MLWEDNYLAHYGIKGQSWGLRRFQNEDGTLTPEGMRRYGIGDGRQISSGKYNALRTRYQFVKRDNDSILKKISEEKKNNVDIGNRRRALEQKYLEKGYTKENAELQAYKDKQRETLIKAVAGIALAAAITYGAIKGKQFISRYADKTIKSGKLMQRITDTPTDDMKRTVYISPDKADFVKYRGQYGAQINQRHQAIEFQNGLNKFLGNGNTVKTPDGIYQVTANAKNNLKIAGERNSVKVFNKLLKTDSEFRKNFEKIKAETPSYAHNGSDYELFNRHLTGLNDNESAKRMRDVFYKALKDKGYNGLIDINDRRFSGYNSKNPTILFDFGKNIKNIGLRKMSIADIEKDFELSKKAISRSALKAQNAEKFKNFLKTTTIRGGIGAGIMVGGDKLTRLNNDKNASYYRSIINNYKKEHPATKLSDDQILENLLSA